MSETTFTEVRLATIKLCEERGKSMAQALLWEYGCKLADLPSNLFGEFLFDVRAILKAPPMPASMYPVDYLRNVLSAATGQISWLEATEPKRAPLTWNKPAQIDRFPGFTSCYDGPHYEHGPIHAAQHRQRRPPLHGSAYLKVA